MWMMLSWVCHLMTRNDYSVVVLICDQRSGMKSRLKCTGKIWPHLGFCRNFQSFNVRWHMTRGWRVITWGSQLQNQWQQLFTTTEMKLAESGSNSTIHSTGCIVLMSSTCVTFIRHSSDTMITSGTFIFLCFLFIVLYVVVCCYRVWWNKSFQCIGGQNYWVEWARAHCCSGRPPIIMSFLPIYEHFWSISLTLTRPPFDTVQHATLVGKMAQLVPATVAWSRFKLD